MSAIDMRYSLWADSIAEESEKNVAFSMGASAATAMSPRLSPSRKRTHHQALSCHTAHLRRMRGRGGLPVHKVGRIILIASRCRATTVNYVRTTP
jgi:hypothetical protein